MTQNQIAYQNMRENQRANLERESETRRSNMTRESETRRSNLAGESISHKEIDRKAHEYSDMAAYNKAYSAASTAERISKSAHNAASTVKVVKDTLNPLKIFN